MRSKLRFMIPRACFIFIAACSALALSRQLPPATRQEMESFVACPAEGEFRNGGKATGQVLEMNLLKNRSESPKSFDPTVTLARMRAPGEDSERWDAKKDIGVRVTGYVAFMIQNFEGESCNCFKTDDAHSDTHIDLVVYETTAFDFATHVIVEVTPRMKFLAKKRGLNWSTASLARQFSHKWVTVEGWLMWDGEHRNEAKNTHPLDPVHRNWRATCWEVHPVTDIRLTNKGRG